jgi:uncharacterized protein
VTDPTAFQPEPDPLAPVAPGRGARPTALFRLVALLQVILVSGFPTQLGLGGLLLLAGFRPFAPDGRLALGYVSTIWLSDTVLMLALIAWFLHAAGERPVPILLGTRRPTREALLGLLLIPVVFVLVAIVLAALQKFAPWLHNVGTNPLEGLIRTRRDAWVLGTLAVLSGGVREEIQRAFILHRFEQALGGAGVGLMVFSLVFGAGHLIQGWDVGVTTMVLGLFWGVVYLWRRSIGATVVSHAGFNLAEVFRYTLFGA